MTRDFDVVVIGSGSAATTVVLECRKAGWQVAVVDSRPFGGTCALRGCDPKKVLVGGADTVEAARRLNGKGVHGEQASVNWADLIRFKRTFTEPYPARLIKTFEDAGAVPLSGRAKFVDRTSVEVGSNILRARFVAITAGSRPATLHIPGENFLITSEQFLELDRLPPSLVFIGGGYIAFEFAHIAAAAGSKVTILHEGARPLGLFDPDLVDRLVAHNRALGIDIQVNTRVIGVEQTSSGFTVHASQSPQPTSFETECVVHAAGRVPDIDDMNLAAGGVEAERRGIRVDQHLRSVSNPAVYAGGDAAASGGPPLTPVASYEGAIIAENLLHGNRRQGDYSNIPSVVFSTPPLACVGLQAETARAQGLEFRTNLLDSSQWYSSRRVAAGVSGIKILIEKGTDRILGAHLLGLEAEETINLFVLAIRHGITASALQHTIFTYPTHASDIKYMLE